MRYQRERIEDTWAEAESLIHANNRETGVIPASEFKPDRDGYIRAERMELIRLFTARADSGKLVGYMTVAVAPGLHGAVWAVQDSMYVDPPYRGVAAVRLLEFADQELAQVPGITQIVRQSIIGTRWGRVLGKVGYRPHSTTYVRGVTSGA